MGQTTADNRVQVQGRLSADPDVRTLPSGDQIVLLKVLVRRPDGSRSDSLPVAVGPPPGRGNRRRPGQATAAVLRRAEALEKSDVVIVEGWLQRRFWASPDGSRRSRLQIVASSVSRGDD